MQLPENGIQQRFLHLETLPHDQFTHTIRDRADPEGMFLSDNGAWLIDWIERLPMGTLDAHPRIGLLYTHALLITQQYERARWNLQTIEHTLQSGEFSEKESIQAQITSLRTYLTMHQELVSQRRETFHHIVGFITNTMLEMDPSSQPVPDLSMMYETLSKRELEVLSCIASGMSNQEIAQTIVVTVGTVKRHINNIYNKLNVHSRIQAVRYAQTHNLLPQL